LRFCRYLAQGLAEPVSEGLLDHCVVQVAGEIKKLGLWREAAELVQDDGDILQQMAIDDLGMRANSLLKSWPIDERQALSRRMALSAALDSFGAVQEHQDATLQRRGAPPGRAMD
jgi:hypothetical protein